MGFVLIDWMKLDGWKEEIPFYLIKCPIHRYQISYPSGFKGTLSCPKCICARARHHSEYAVADNEHLTPEDIGRDSRTP